MGRINSHVIETKAVDFVRSTINSYYSNGDALYREISDRDYGIDAIIELFDDGEPTGRIAFAQVKGTEENISPLKKNNIISCHISSSNAKYARQKNIPVLLIYVSLKSKIFYFTMVQNSIDLRKIGKQKNHTVYIPIQNNFQKNPEKLFDLIREYYDKVL